MSEEKTWRDGLGLALGERSAVWVPPRSSDIYDEPAFTIWTSDRVYFPVQYDGMGWVGSVPRNPCDEATSPMGA